VSCGGTIATFRLLDAIVGWEQGTDAGAVTGLVGLDDPNGVTLAPLHPGEASGISAWLPPPWLAPGCGPCELYLAARASSDPAGPCTVLLRLDACACAWQPVWRERCTPLPGARISAVAAAGHLLAVGDDAGGDVLLFADDGDRCVATLACPDVAAMTFAPGRVLIVAQREERRLLRFDAAGTPLDPFAPALPDGVTAARLGVGRDGRVWAASAGSAAGAFKLWSARAGDAAFLPAGLADLAASMPLRTLASDDAQGFCLTRNDTDGSPVRCCYDRAGNPRASPDIAAALPLYRTQGDLVTAAIDSGIPRCIWHRVRIDADLPVGTSVSVDVASADAPKATPHPLDWQAAAPRALDFLIRQPPGRYLFLRLHLQSSNGVATPRVRRIRIDFPRVTSLDQLPGIYRENADAADFTERFLALFDASIADLDAAIERAPALLDAGGDPDDVLPWLASFVGLALDPAWSPERSRAILRAIPELYRRRGTLGGMKLAFGLVFDVEPAIEELAATRPWAALGRQSRIGGFRLFGRDRARAIVGRSAIGATTLKSYGDPASDPLDAVAYRFRVQVPPMPAGRRAPLARMQALIDSQKPAHTIASLRVGGGFRVGASAAVGIDTVFAPLPAPVLGRAGNVRLNRMSVLRPARGGRRRAQACGWAVGLQSLTE
jgi:phage tail-like protein